MPNYSKCLFRRRNAYMESVWWSKLQLISKTLWCASTQSIEHVIITFRITLDTDAWLLQQVVRYVTTTHLVLQHTQSTGTVHSYVISKYSFHHYTPMPGTCIYWQFCVGAGCAIASLVFDFASPVWHDATTNCHYVYYDFIVSIENLENQKFVWWSFHVWKIHSFINGET